MKGLYIDIGNSYIKAAEQVGLNWHIVYREKTARKKEFYSWLDDHVDHKIMVTSVVNEITKVLDNRYPEEILRVIRYRDIPKEFMEYDSPDTLGMDRVLACLGAAELTPRAVVVIDAGTACTIDYMTAGGVYQGGVIMPGLHMIFQMILRDLPSLPGAGEVLPEGWPGKSSEESVRWGTTGAYIEAIRGFLDRYRQKFGEFDLFVTGGGAKPVIRYLHRDYELKERQFLVFEGMKLVNERYSRRKF